ncbi:DNA cytosine methyltransferase [Vitreoscilla filiformis]|nr:DNA (cytosine-5-)-methyltransferase [Vitreoscilla filiformis]
MTIPVIDLFAGPGGLGEGLCRSCTDFRIVLSVEKDGMAFETLRLRAAHRALLRVVTREASEWAIWDEIVEVEPWNIVFDQLMTKGGQTIRNACKEADREAWHFELGHTQRKIISTRIRERLTPYAVDGGLPDNIVLIGGPPCQAYSIVGRARNRSKDGYKAENDHRHFLYREYLDVINEFRPAVFIMENVKGILSSTIEGRQIFETITNDLRHPSMACNGGTDGPRYVLVALARGADGIRKPAHTAEDFIIQTEKLGLPQARHRVVICGVREDIFYKAGNHVPPLTPADSISVFDAISDLPRLRPDVSFRGQGLSWKQSLSLPLMDEALKQLRERGEEGLLLAASMVHHHMQVRASTKDPGPGSNRIRCQTAPHVLRDWYLDRSSNLLTNHESRAHMPEDLLRYFFMAVAGLRGSSPRLADFPPCLLPRHKNVDPSNLETAIFKDRFRVQLAYMHSKTITSHIGKDGHAFIHYDPLQCRSLTVREAARLQTFSDSYVFLGNRTSQYTQVGNAVPPLLATKIGQIIAYVLQRAYSENIAIPAPNGRDSSVSMRIPVGA